MAKVYTHAEIDLCDIPTDDLSEALQERGALDAHYSRDRNIIEAIQKEEYEAAFNLLFEKLEGIAAEERAEKYREWLAARGIAA